MLLYAKTRSRDSLSDQSLFTCSLTRRPSLCEIAAGLLSPSDYFRLAVTIAVRASIDAWPPGHEYHERAIALKLLITSVLCYLQHAGSSESCAGMPCLQTLPLQHVLPLPSPNALAACSAASIAESDDVEIISSSLLVATTTPECYHSFGGLSFESVRTQLG